MPIIALYQSQAPVSVTPTVVPLTATITAGETQIWAALVQPTVVPAGGDGVYTYLWTLFADGIDYSARLSSTVAANPTFTPFHIGHRVYTATCIVSDGSGQSYAYTYTLTLGDANGWVDFPLDTGTLQDGTGQVDSRTATSVTLADNAIPAEADRPVIYEAIEVAPSVRSYTARYIMDVAWQDADRRAITQMLITADPTDLPNEAKTFGGGAYQNPADTYFSRLRIGNGDTSANNAATRGGVGYVFTDEDQAALGDAQAQTVDIDGAFGVTHAEADWNGVDMSSGLFAAVRAYSIGAEGIGPKTITGSWQIRGA